MYHVINKRSLNDGTPVGEGVAARAVAGVFWIQPDGTESRRYCRSEVDHILTARNTGRAEGGSRGGSVRCSWVQPDEFRVLQFRKSCRSNGRPCALTGRNTESLVVVTDLVRGHLLTGQSTVCTDRGGSGASLLACVLCVRWKLPIQNLRHGYWQYPEHKP